MSAAAPEPDTPPPPPQIIPRPAGSSAGPGAAWVGRVADPIPLATVRRVLTTPFDPDRRPGAPRESAVLAAFFADADGEARVLLTRRASTLRNHRSEVSFPGGRVEAGETLLGAALRESYEEIGLEPSLVEPIGPLAPLMTFSSQAMIHPFAAVLAERPALQANPAEVELVFDVPLSDLLASYHSERWGIAGAPRILHFFELPADIVWGATGRILWEILCRLTVGPPELEPGQDPIP